MYPLIYKKSGDLRGFRPPLRMRGFMNIKKDRLPYREVPAFTSYINSMLLSYHEIVRI